MRAVRWIVVLMVALFGLQTFAGPASGGGSWISPGRTAYVPGEIATFKGTFSSGSLEGRIGDGPYIAYLIPRERWIQNQVVPASAIRLGALEIVRGSAHLFRARVEFEVPAVPTGMYHIGYCNEPCTVNGIGDLVGSEHIAIAASREEGRLLILAEHLRQKVRTGVRARHQIDTRLDRLQETLDARTSELGAARVRLEALADELAKVRRSLSRERASGPLGPVIIGLLLGLAVIVIIRQARSLRRVRFDAEVHALTHERSFSIRV